MKTIRRPSIFFTCQKLWFYVTYTTFSLNVICIILIMLITNFKTKPQWNTGIRVAVEKKPAYNQWQVLILDPATINQYARCYHSLITFITVFIFHRPKWQPPFLSGAPVSRSPSALFVVSCLFTALSLLFSAHGLVLFYICVCLRLNIMATCIQ